ncbi:MAG: hypothetical protein M3P27_02905 [Acidobacteriota bacterium]|nr:hypothetical protein [Acidobacteriota bacterium]
MDNKQYGTGAVYILGPNVAPQKLGILQEVSLSFKGTIKKLYGQDQMPVDSGRSNIDVTGKAKLADLNVDLMNAVFFGAAPSEVGAKTAIDEQQTIGALGSPVLDLTVTVDHGDDFDKDAGVVLKGGARLKVATSAPDEGEYSVDETTGTYTFDSSAAGKVVIISYVYNDADAGKTVTMSNQPAGDSPEVRLLVFNKHRGKRFGVELNNVQFTDISIASKQGDFWSADVSFDAFCDDSNELGNLYGD